MPPAELPNLAALLLSGGGTKLAVGVARAVRLLQARAQQGAAVAPAIMQHAQQSTGETSPALRRLLLGLGEDVRAHARLEAVNRLPTVAAGRERILQGYARTLNPEVSGVYDKSKRLLHHDSIAQYGYSRAHLKQLTDGPRVYDPRKLLGTNPQLAHAPTQATPHSFSDSPTLVDVATRLGGKLRT